MSQPRSDIECGNLISFDDHILSESVRPSSDTSSVSSICDRLTPNIRRVLLTEIQYYREPFNVPIYDRDDFFRDDDNDLSTCYDTVEKTYNAVESSSKSISNDVAPPLPPRRYKSPDKLSLSQRITSAGISLDTKSSCTNNSPAETTSNSERSNIDPFDGIDPFSKHSLSDQNDDTNNLISQNLFEFDVGFQTNNIGIDDVIDEKKTSKNSLTEFSSQPYGSNLKSLSHQDILSFEEEVGLNLDKVNQRKSVTLPLRPPAPNKKNCASRPKSFNCCNSGQSTNDILFQSGLFRKTEERNEEVAAFSDFVLKLRKWYSHNDHETNNGHISAAIIHNKALYDKTSTIYVYFDPDPEPKQLHCKLYSTCSDVIHLFFKEFYNGDDSYEFDIIAEQYTLRFLGFTSCISDNTPLSDFVIIQECIKNGYDIKLALIRTDFINVDFKRDEQDNEEKITFEYHFQNPNSFSISEEGLSVLLDTYNNEAARLLQDVSQTHKVVYRPERLIQVVKAITKSLAQVELLSVQDAVNLLLSLKKTSKHSTLQLYNNEESKRNYNEYINPVHFDKGRFHQALQKLTLGVLSQIKLYCKAFNTDFQIQNSNFPTENEKPNEVFERIDPRTINDNFCVRICSVQRIPPSWKYDFTEFQLQMGLYYGGNMLCTPQKTLKCQIALGFFEQIRFYEFLQFDIPIKEIPRESKLTFTLVGLSPPKKGDDGQTTLGWVSCNVYDYRGFLLSGSVLFGLLSDVEFNPVATCSTGYIQNPGSIILKTDFQLYHTDVLFPQPVLITPGIVANKQSLSEPELKYVKKIFRKDPSLLTSEERRVVWKSRYNLCNLPHALIYVLVSCPSWDSVNVSEVHAILSLWESLSPIDAIEFLQADFPDKAVREIAVLWLSKITDDDLCDCLPELVQALKYEAYHNSALAQMLIKRSLTNSRVAHFLFWNLKYYAADPQFSQRFQIVLGGLLSVVGVNLRKELELQYKMVTNLSSVAQKIKECKDSSREACLVKELSVLGNNQDDFPLRLPIEPSIKLSGILPNKCSYFSSNTVPLKIALKNSDPRGKPLCVIYKIGDDLRKDLVTLLMFRVMNKLWLSQGLDLKMMLYNVLPTGPLKGLIEIVPNAATFREIHIQHGLTGSFKDDSLALWLQKYNTSEDQYKTAINNFTLSAAGYCVATYVLGIGDRHNDNIMLTRNGHLFHIDFSKFMGDVQKFGSISRDRVPFILTPDMAFVINNGHAPTHNFQLFVEHCCLAFNIIRSEMKVFLNLLSLMVYSGIPYLSNKQDLRYIRRNLQSHLTDDEATMYFTRLIESSLSSRSTQLNFFIHNIAQMKNATETTLRSSKSSALFSFSNKVHNEKIEGEVFSARIVDFQKRYLPEKHYVFVINTLRSNIKGPKFIFRRYEDFQELHAKLTYSFNAFSDVALPELPPRILIGRSQIRDVAQRRKVELDEYLVSLSQIEVVWHSDIMCTFLHSYIKDNEEARRFSEYVEFMSEGPKSRIGGKIKLSISYKNQCLNILIMHATKLIPNRIQGLADPFVKCYVLPDPFKFYKRKTRVCRKTLNPTFNETLQYDVAWELLQKRILQVTLWDSNSLSENEFLGGINFYLSTIDVMKPLTGWFELTDIGLRD